MVILTGRSDKRNMIVDTFENIMQFRAEDELFFIPIFENPLDYPGKYVARLRIMKVGKDTPTKYIVVKDTLEELEKCIPEEMVNIPPFPEDDKKIIKVYL